jgi:hypothetical protein
MPSSLPLNLADLLRQRTVDGDRIEYKTGYLGGPAACAAPGGSRSDKRLRRAGSIERSTCMPGLHRPRVGGTTTGSYIRNSRSRFGRSPPTPCRWDRDWKLSSTVRVTVNEAAEAVAHA